MTETGTTQPTTKEPGQTAPTTETGQTAPSAAPQPGAEPGTTAPAPQAAPGARKQKISPLSDVILYFLAIFIPPLSVFFKRGFAADFWINIGLWILGWIPGVLHAWWVISKTEGAV